MPDKVLPEEGERLTHTPPTHSPKLQEGKKHHSLPVQFPWEELTNSRLQFKMNNTISTIQRMRRNARLMVMGSKDKPPLMIEPNSMNKLAWDLGVITPLIAYLTLTMPFRMCFQNPARGGMAIFEMCIDIVFIIDIFVNFRTAYHDPFTGESVYDPYKIAKQYIRSWFIIDVVSGIPFGVLDLKAFDGNENINVLKKSAFLKTTKVLRFLKLSRLLKGTRIFSDMDEELVDRIQDFMADGTTKTCLRMIRIIAVLVFICHVMACLWVLVGRTAEQSGRDNWLETFFGFEAVDTTDGITVSRVYLASFYYCFTTMTGVGYGDITPQSDRERGFAICLEGVGGFTYAFIIGSLTSIVSMQDSNNQEVGNRIDTVSSYINMSNIPDDLGRRVRRYYRHYFSHRTALDECLVLKDLNTSLRLEVSAFLVHDMGLGEVMLFKLINPIHWSHILPLLRPCMFAKDEVLCYQGEYCSDAYVITDGCLTASSNNANMGYLVDHVEHHEVLDEGDLSEPDKHSKLYAESTKACAMAAAAMICGRAPKWTHMMALHPEHQSLHHSLQLISSIKAQVDDYEDETPETLERKRIASASMFQSIVGSIQPKKQFHLRAVNKRQVLGMLTMLKVYNRNLETAKAVGYVQAYAISCDTFYSVFSQYPEMIDKLRERVTETHFKMVSHPEASTKYGVPLYRYRTDEIKDREKAYLQRMLQTEKEIAEQVRSDGGIVLNAKDSEGSIHEEWTATKNTTSPETPCSTEVQHLTSELEMSAV